MMNSSKKTAEKRCLQIERNEASDPGTHARCFVPGGKRATTHLPGSDKDGKAQPETKHKDAMRFFTRRSHGAPWDIGRYQGKKPMGIFTLLVIATASLSLLVARIILCKCIYREFCPIILAVFRHGTLPDRVTLNLGVSHIQA